MRFHVSTDGVARHCAASDGNCPLKDDKKNPIPHGDFSTVAEANIFAEGVNAVRFADSGGPLNKKSYSHEEASQMQLQRTLSLMDYQANYKSALQERGGKERMIGELKNAAANAYGVPRHSVWSSVNGNVELSTKDKHITLDSLGNLKEAREFDPSATVSVWRDRHLTKRAKVEGPRWQEVTIVGLANEYNVSPAYVSLHDTPEGRRYLAYRELNNQVYVHDKDGNLLEQREPRAGESNAHLHRY